MRRVLSWRQGLPRSRFARLSLLKQFSLVSFVLLAAFALLLAYGIQQQLEQNALRQEAESAAAQVARILDPNLQPSDLSSPLSAVRYQQVDNLVHTNIMQQHIVRVRIWGSDGTLIYSDQNKQVGERFPIEDELADALGGTIGMDVSKLDKAENQDERQQFDRLLEVYVPLRPMGAGQVMGAYEIYRDLTQLEPHIADMQRFVWSSVGIGFVLLYASLFTLVRGASRELVRRNAENARLYGETKQLYRDLSLSYDHTLDTLAAALDARDKETEGHSRRVVTYTLALARQLGVPADELDMLQRGALLHDIGKIGVPDAILLKPSALAADEWTVMRRHPEWGQRILSGIPFLEPAARVVYAHQERWDGKGYPRGSAAESIPLGARIFAIADTFDAITSERPYRAARSYAVARAEIEKGAGTQFDPLVVAAFLAIPEAAWQKMRASPAVDTAMASRQSTTARPNPSRTPIDEPAMVGSLSGSMARTPGR
jgi:putative nucleotidyltransferase with HDIG domain